MGYQSVYEAWKNDPEAFWMQAAAAIDWDQPPSKALTDKGDGLYEWFADAKVNTCWNAVDRHVEAGRGDQTAIIYDSPVTGTVDKISYAELQSRVASLAGALRAQGVEKGDRVIIYMPMVPQALEAMLACGRIGAIHSVVFGGFAANELAVRIDDASPKAVIAASCGIEPGHIVEYKPLLDAAIEAASHKPDFCVILQREQHQAEMMDGRDFDYHGFQEDVTPADCLPGRRQSPLLHFVHLRHHRAAQRRDPPHCGPAGGAELDHAGDLQRAAGGCLLGSLGCGLGRGTFLHLLRATHSRQHNDRV